MISPDLQEQRHTWWDMRDFVLASGYCYCFALEGDQPFGGRVYCPSLSISIILLSMACYQLLKDIKLLSGLLG